MTQEDRPARAPAESDASASNAQLPRRATGLEATELARITSVYSHASTTNRNAAVRSTRPKPSGVLQLTKYRVSKFWRAQISVNVPHESCRDHLALERTFLGYLRTSLAISMIGVTVAQLFRLQHAPNPSPTFGFYVLGKPLACLCQGAAIYSLLLGSYRAWRHQNAMVRGKAITGGFELVLVGLGIMALCIIFFILLVAVDISKD